MPGHWAQMAHMPRDGQQCRCFLAGELAHLVYKGLLAEEGAFGAKVVL